MANAAMHTIKTLQNTAFFLLGMSVNNCEIKTRKSEFYSATVVSKTTQVHM